MRIQGSDLVVCHKVKVRRLLNIGQHFREAVSIDIFSGSVAHLGDEV